MLHQDWGVVSPQWAGIRSEMNTVRGVPVHHLVADPDPLVDDQSLGDTRGDRHGKPCDRRCGAPASGRRPDAYMAVIAERMVRNGVRHA